MSNKLGKLGKKGKTTPTSNVNSSEMKNFITYFQSVTTIGIVSRAKTSKEAEEISKKKLSNSEVSCGLVNQTPYEIGGTDEWKVDCNKFTCVSENK